VRHPLGSRPRRALRPRFVTRIRVRIAMAAQALEQGRYLGGRPPYGYRLGDAGLHPNKAHAAWGHRARRLEPDQETAPVVIWMSAQRLADHSVARIAGAERGGRALPVGGRPRPRPRNGSDRAAEAPVSGCGRRMESAWSNGKPAYRCRHGHTTASSRGPGRLTNAYIREDRILTHDWLPAVGRRRMRSLRVKPPVRPSCSLVPGQQLWPGCGRLGSAAVHLAW
jgi:hypothetical protein